MIVSGCINLRTHSQSRNIIGYLCTHSQSCNIIGYLCTHSTSHNTIGQCLLYNLSHTAVSLVLYAVDKGLRGRNVLQSLLLILLRICSRSVRPMCTCTLYNMVTCLLQSLDQSTTDNYQLLTLKHCIISPVNTHKYCTYPSWVLHCDMFQRTVSVSQCSEQWQRVDVFDGQFPQLTHCLTTCGHS